MEWFHVWGEMFNQAAGVHWSSSSAVYRLCAVPTGCSDGLRPCVWWGAEGRRAPRWGSRTGAAGTVLLPQERAVQTAWRSGDDKQPHAAETQRFKPTKNIQQKTRSDAPEQRDVGKVDEAERQDKKQESRRKTVEVRFKMQEVQSQRERIVETHEEERDTWRREKKKLFPQNGGQRAEEWVNK